MLDTVNSILIKQMDIASDLERFLIMSSKGPAFNGTVKILCKWFACVLMWN